MFQILPDVSVPKYLKTPLDQGKRWTNKRSDANRFGELPSEDVGYCKPTTH